MLFKKISVFILFFFILTFALAAEVNDSSIAEDTKNLPTNLKKTSEVNTPTDVTKPLLVKSISPGFTVRLLANNTTGYQWYLADYNPRFVRLLDQQYVPASTKMVGSRGMSVWQFQMQQISFAAPQVTRIIFEYRRPWELKPIKKQSVVVITQQPTKGE